VANKERHTLFEIISCNMIQKLAVSYQFSLFISIYIALFFPGGNLIIQRL